MNLNPAVTMNNPGVPPPESDHDAWVKALADQAVELGIPKWYARRMVDENTRRRRAANQALFARE